MLTYETKMPDPNAIYSAKCFCEQTVKKARLTVQL